MSDVESEDEGGAPKPQPEEATASDSKGANAQRPRRRSAWWRRVRIAAWVVGVVAALVVPLALRAGWEGRAELAEADRAHEAGDLDREIEHLGRAARWRVPGLSHDEEAVDRLIAIGEAREAEGPDETQTALSAYREARRALLATRAWGVPRRDVFDELNDRIAHLMAAQEAEFGTDVSGSGDPYAYHRQLLDRVPGPNPWRGNLAAIAFVGWLVATAGFVLRGIDARGRLRPKPALRWGGVSLLLLVAWALLLRFS